MCESALQQRRQLLTRALHMGNTLAMGLVEDFNASATEAKTLPASTSNEDQLILYGLFKQANVGDNETNKPGMIDFKGKAKWEAWNKNKGMSKDDAMENYIAKVEQLKEG